MPVGYNMIGKTLAQYEILDEVSRGGMGVVYRARDVRLGREVALKVLPAELVSDSNRRTRFEREARAAAALEHPGIGLIYGLQEDQGVGFIVMELIRGRSLKEMIEAGEPDRAHALELAIEIAEGLAHAHERKILHRDLKPANIMITNEGRAKIIDFGLAKLIDPAAMEASWLPTQIHGETASGVILGTPSYMSPEQARGEPADERSDIFSFGVVAFEMIARRRPFSGSNAADVVSAILRDPVPSLDARGPATDEISAGLEDVLGRCLAKRREDRYASMREVAADLRALRYFDSATQSGVSAIRRASASREIPATTRRTWLLPVAGALAAVAALLATWWALDRGGESGPTTLAAAKGRSSVAVLGFKNLSGRPETTWLSTAFAEMLRTELSAGEGVGVVPGEAVARARIELGIGDEDSYSPATVASLRDNLGSDFLVIGSYTALGSSGGGQIRLDLRLQAADSGEIVASIATTGTEAELFDLVGRTGAQLREELSVGAVSAEQVRAAQAAQSGSAEATRYYAEGLEQLRAFDAVAAQQSLARAVEIDPGFALGHVALSQAWAALGFERQAAEEAGLAYELGSDLPREQLLRIEARFREASGEWAQAATTYQALWSFYPEDTEYGLRLAEARTRAGDPEGALATLDALRASRTDGREDPRVDLAEARAAEAMSDYDRQLLAVDRVVAIAEERGAWLTVAEARFLQGRAQIRFGQPQAARANLEEARALFERAGSRSRAAECLNQMAILERQGGQLGAAETLYGESLRITRETGNRAATSYVLNNLALVVWERGDLGGAEAKLAEAVELAEQSGSGPLQANALDSLSSIQLDQGRIADAEATAARGLEIARQVGERSIAAWLLRSMGQAEAARGLLARAAASYDEAERLTVEVGYPHLQAYVLESRAELKLQRADFTGVTDDLAEVRRIRTELNERSALAETTLGEAGLAFATGDLQRALDLAESAQAELLRADIADSRGSAAALVARIHLARGDIELAERAMAPAVKQAETTQSPVVRLELRLAQAAVLGRRDAPAANRLLSQLLQDADTLGLPGYRLLARLEAALLVPDGAARRTALEGVAVDAEAGGWALVAGTARAALAGR